MHTKNKLGLHLRLNTTLQQLVQEALQYPINSFQFFLTPSHNEKYITVTKSDETLFSKIHDKYLTFIHSSYWINPATGRAISYEISEKLLKKEISVAHRLSIPYIVLHPGSATWHKTKPEDPYCKKRGIQQVAQLLNTVLKKEANIRILLENTAHGNRSIGSDLNDFIEIKKLLDFPDKIGFCLDLAHAFVYGYPLDPVENFLNLVETTMGINNIHLIHFNDTSQKLGSKRDTHAIPGEGLIGIKPSSLTLKVAK